MLDEEDIYILDCIKEYMQNSIDRGYHKWIFNDFGWDLKCIDIINTIDKILQNNKKWEVVVKWLKE